ncbi:unnamed protein product [Rotaria sordida]|uniref:Uncharacterized protein n=1 Tax=Rotaria sordida TaxID=392033 RepID=A0A815HL47_9BILA|nr:unnamed protein product [Rotaria sordida]CAF1352156.1 unnamed protein product [Rotaria sordida]
MPIYSTLLKNFERLSTHDLLSYGQLSCDTILTSIHKQLSNLYDLYDEYFRTLNDVINKLGELFINEHVNKEQEMIDRLSIISSSDSIFIEPVEELCKHIKQPSTLPLLLAHIGLSDRLMHKMILEFAASIQHLYSQIVAYTIPAVFCGLINAHYLAKVNKWTFLLMNSIAQRKSIRMAIWGLNCLMLSTCPSHKTTNTFIIKRIRKLLTNIEQVFTNQLNTEKLQADLLAAIQDTILSSS